MIQWGDTAGTPGSNGHPMGTYYSATVAVNSNYFIAKNLTFKVLIWTLCFEVDTSPVLPMFWADTLFLFLMMSECPPEKLDIY